MNAERHEWYWRGYNDAKKQEHREFVGLTDEEIKQMGLSNYIKVVRETESKLKEKNRC